jgi:hypothetical protein
MSHNYDKCEQNVQEQTLLEQLLFSTTASIIKIKIFQNEITIQHEQNKHSQNINKYNKTTIRGIAKLTPTVKS